MIVTGGLIVRVGTLETLVLNVFVAYMQAKTRLEQHEIPRFEADAASGSSFMCD